MSNHRDIALDALLHPFAEGALRWSADALFLRAREGAALHARGGLQSLACTQPFKPEADRLQRIGVTLVDEDAVARRALPAGAGAAAAPARGGARVAGEGLHGGGTRRHRHCLGGQRRGREIARGRPEATRRHGDHAQQAPLPGVVDAAGCDLRCGLLAQWAKADAPRKVISPNVPGGRFMSRPGVFAWDRIDAASAMLAAALPDDLHGRVADLGAGFGYLSMQVLARCPDVTSLDLYEAEARALALAAREPGRCAQCRWIATGTTSPPACRTLRRHRLQSALPCAGSRRSPRHRPRLHRRRGDCAEARRPAVAGRQPAPALRARAGRGLRASADAVRRTAASRSSKRRRPRDEAGQAARQPGLRQPQARAVDVPRGPHHRRRRRGAVRRRPAGPRQRARRRRAAGPAAGPDC